MDNSSLYRRLYQKPKEFTFSFDTLTGPGVYQLFTPTDVGDLYSIATSVRLNAKIKQKYQFIDDIMKRRGFKKFGAGYNRVVYKYLENQSFLAKVAIDNVGITDNPAEFKNQWLIQPFCTKIFDVDQTGVISIVERVQPITSLKEYIANYESIFALLNNITGKYVASDIGCDFFRNIGIREGFGPVLLDFPYIYVLDGDKLFCSLIFPNGELCAGEIDYDDGFNNLICTKCGKRYSAKDLSKESTEFGFIIKKGRAKMRVVAKRGDKIIVDSGNKNSAEVIQRQSKRRKKFEEATKSTMKVKFYGWHPEGEEKEEPVVEEEEKTEEPMVEEVVTEPEKEFDANTGFVTPPDNEEVIKALESAFIIRTDDENPVEEPVEEEHQEEPVKESLEDRVGSIISEQEEEIDTEPKSVEKYEAISFGYPVIPEEPEPMEEEPIIKSMEEAIERSIEEQAITAPDFPDVDLMDQQIAEEKKEEEPKPKEKEIPVYDYDYIPGSDSKYPAKPKRKG